MQQLNITYFFPLTEQIELDLDYTPCKKYEEDKRKEASYSSVLSGVPLTFTGSTIISPYMCIDKDSMPIIIKSKDKPNLLQRYVYKALGLKWETK